MVLTLMKPVKVQKEHYVYTKGAPIDEVYFLVKGKASFVLPNSDDMPYVNIHPNDYIGDIDYVDENMDGKRKFTIKA